MRITRIFAALLAALCILSILPLAGAMSIQMDPLASNTGSALSASAASANDNYPISVEQAKNSVRIFMNDLTSRTGSRFDREPRDRELLHC